VSVTIRLGWDIFFSLYSPGTHLTLPGATDCCCSLREKWTQFKLPHMLLGLAGLLGAAVWLLRGAGLAVSACAGSDALPATESTPAPVKSAPALPAPSLLGLVALPAGALFLAMAGYSDNFTVYVSRGYFPPELPI
jgi:hypothetical protein